MAAPSKDAVTCRVMRKTQPRHYVYRTAAYDQAQWIGVMYGRLRIEPLAGGPTVSGPLVLRPGLGVLLRAGGAFRLSCPGPTGYQGIGMLVQREVPAVLSGAPMAAPVAGRLALLVKMTWQHMQTPQPESTAILRGLGTAILWETIAQTRVHEGRPAQDWAAAARAAIDLNCGTGTPLRAVLRGIPLGYRHLYRCFLSRYGKTPKHYQEERRHEQARQLLVNTTWPITAIALELGFASSQHFALRFRRMEGCPPSAYRRNHA